ncbi:MAG: M48 family metalloprotease [Thermoplasmata archaeon]|uniref:M48 family metalloprotease n=1 Tax=Candidatus Sysuiplasma superficiale TaxID=2823368 RepID=A0A8J8CAG7_9ARCH|nr:M48 family metalloprotease [Candidatus Sysuiplasma superficiale]MBX8644960.1 M48 family metalloprotease [Candidatus Sysuiplasma superficiale]MCL4346967.1 M48 family metalloprotease [Candidatus Thermoplasmatota archaeon]
MSSSAERESASSPEGVPAFPYEFDGELRKRARTLSDISFRISVLSAAAGFALTLFLIASGAGEWLSVRLRAFPSFFQIPLYVCAVVTLFFLTGLPFAWEAHRKRKEFGISVSSGRRWALDAAKGYLLSLLVSATAALLLIELIAISAQWWIYAATFFILFSVAYSRFFPLLAPRLFYRFSELPEGEVKDSITQLLKSAGLGEISICVINESSRSRTANAFVTGIGRARRIVLFDNLLKSFAPSEIRCITAHELGHYRSHDSLRSTLLMAIETYLYAAVMYAALRFALRFHLVYSATDPYVLVLMSFAAMMAGAAIAPLSNLYSRRREMKADEFSLMLCGDPVAFISSEKRLCDMNMMHENPPKLRRIFFATHPSTQERIRMGEEWMRRTTG